MGGLPAAEATPGVSQHPVEGTDTGIVEAQEWVAGDVQIAARIGTVLPQKWRYRLRLSLGLIAMVDPADFCGGGAHRGVFCVFEGTFPLTNERV